MVIVSVYTIILLNLRENTVQLAQKTEDLGTTSDMTETDKDTRLVRGWVKWFDPDKGFGFVVSDEGGPDILLHLSLIHISEPTRPY